LDVVDEGEFGVPLAGLLEESGILERNAQGARERREQADVRLAECMLAVDVLQGDNAGRRSTDDERYVHGRSRWLTLDEPTAQRGNPLLEAILDEERRTRLDDMRRRSGVERGRFVRLALIPLDRV